MLNVYGLVVSVNYENHDVNQSFERFRSHIRSVLQDSNRFMAVNFYGKSLGVNTSGHISPLAAYDQGSDSVWIMDVATHKNHWYWVSVDSLKLCIPKSVINLEAG